MAWCFVCGYCDGNTTYHFGESIRCQRRQLEKTLTLYWRMDGCTNGGLPIENCTNFAQMMLLLGSDNWKLLFVHFSKVVLTTSWRSWRPDPNIRTHKKGWWQIWLFCVPYNQRKSQVWLEMNADALTKTANEWDTLRYSVGRRWGEKYFHFWLNTIWESYLGLYLSEVDIFEKFQLWAKYSFAMGWTEPWLIFLKVRSLQILCPLLTNSNKGLCWITTG